MLAIINDTRIKVQKIDNEYQVVVLVDGKRIESRTYYTNDRQDAIETFQAMCDEEMYNQIKIEEIEC